MSSARLDDRSKYRGTARPSVLITAAFDADVAARLREEFAITFHEPLPPGARVVDSPLIEHLATADALICEHERVDADVLNAAPRLALVVSCRGTPVNVDVAASDARGVLVARTPARNADATADITLALILAAMRSTGRAERWMRAGGWRREARLAPYERFRGPELAGRTLGIVGAGAIGRRVARRAQGFGMRAIAYDPHLDRLDGGIELVDLPDLMRSSDVVSIHAPLTPDTHGLVGAAELELMRPDAFLVNAGRAAIVDESALVDALRERRIAGAGFDVYWDEPLVADHPLLALDNVTLLPHIGGASDDVVRNHSEMAAEALIDAREGRRPRHLVGGAAWERRRGAFARAT